ncbi:MAG: MBL fold metallo-hydrolase [Faecalibacterium prausnitzii]
MLLCGEHLFCGDTLFAGSIGRTDLEGGSSAQMAESLRKLAAAAHPPRNTGAARPRRIFYLWLGAGQQLLYPQRPARRQRHFLKRE